MDPTLQKLTESSNISLQLLDESTGEINIVDGDRTEPYTLLPLSRLYGPGNGSAAADPQNETFMPLFLGIEEAIAKYDALQERLTDATVTLSLNQMSMSPDDASTDPLIRHIQAALRMILSLSNYSRQEVRQAIRKIGKSVARHSEGGRNRGYVDFVSQFFAKRR